MFSAASAALTLSISLFSLAFLLRVGLIRPRNSKLKFPPGPPPLPVIGNLHQIPLKKAFFKFTEWSRQYGDVYGLHLGHQKLLVLNSWRAIYELIDQRGINYSSRPSHPLLEYVVPEDAHVAFMKYDKRWRRGRTALTNFLKDEELEKLLPIQQAESTQLLWEILQEPAQYYGHIMRTFSAIIFDSVYGQRGHRRLMEAFFSFQDDWAGTLDAGAFPPLDVFPILKYVPDSVTPWPGWKEKAERLHKAQTGFYSEMFDRAQAKIERGEGRDTFVAKLLQKQANDKEKFSAMELRYVAGFLIEAGADTIAVALVLFVLVMAAFPEIQRKAKAEVDGVFKEEEMPQDADETKLPYLKAVFWEIMRWRPEFPTSIPHATSKDDMYNGYFIPAETTVIINTWAIHHNPDDYPNPDTFDPTRWLNNDLGLTKSASDAPSDAWRRKTYAFGSGRRICAGQDMAEKVLMLSMAKVLWAFDISPVGEGKVDMNMETAFKDAILVGPKEVEMNFEVRSETKKAVIAREWAKADEYLKRFE